MTLSTPLFASERGSTDLTSLINSLQPKDPSQTEDLFNSIATGTLDPEIVDRYSANAAFFLGIYAGIQEKAVSAEKLFLYAAEKSNSELSRCASEEYVRILGRQKKWQELINYFENHSVSGVSAQMAVLYARALLETGRSGPFLEAVEEYQPLVSAQAEPELQARFLLLRVKQAYRTADPVWGQLLMELVAAYTREQLPGELFESEGEMSLMHLSPDVFSQLEYSVLQGKYAYANSEYGTSFSHYLHFINVAAENLHDGSEVYGLISKVINDEFTLSGLYSGRTLEAYAAAETGRRRLDAIVGDSVSSHSPAVQIALFWMLETEAYLARKLGRFSRARELYERALELSPPAEAQRIRWYIFDCTFRANTAEAVSLLPDAAEQWQDPAYYSDVLYNLIDRLISRRQWTQIAVVANELSQAAPGVAAARAAYISARAAEEGYLSAGRQQIIRWLETAVKNSWGTGAGLYYRLMAAAALERYDISIDVMEPSDFCRLLPDQEPNSSGVSRSWGTTEDALINGYVKFGLDDEAYRRYGTDRAYVAGLQLQTVRKWTARLQARGMYLESLRMFGRYCRDTRAPIGRKDVQLLYPAAYDYFIEPLTAEYELPPHIFYALVREESHFKADISSSAGAVGLSQLMPSTAEDVAGRIGVPIHTLTDPQLNLRLGSWYLAHLSGRTDNLSQALFAYNGGITRVRRWVRDAGGVPEDLLLELIPFQETSHYGRKVLVSSVLYGYFYQDIEPTRLIKEYFGQ